MTQETAAVVSSARGAVDLVIMYVGLALRTAAPFALIPLLGRVLGPDHYGLFAIAGAVTMWVWQTTEAGLPTTASREIALAETPEQRSRIASASCAARAVTAVPGLAIGAGIALSIPQLREAPWVAVLAALLGLQSALNLGWLFMACGRRRLLSAAETLPPLLTLALCYVCVTQQDHLVRALLVMNASALCTNLVFWMASRRLVSWTWPRFEDVRRELLGASSFTILRLAGLVNSTIAVYLLGLMTTNAAVAQFSVAEKVINACLAMFIPIYQTIFPLTMQFAVRPREVAGTLWRIAGGIVLLSSIAASVLWFASVELLTALMGPTFADSAQFTRWLALLMPLGVATQLMVNVILMPLRQDRRVLQLNLSLTLLGTATMLGLVSQFDAPGAAAAKAIGAVIGLTATAIVARGVLLRRRTGADLPASGAA